MAPTTDATAPVFADLLEELREFPPPPAFAAAAHVRDEAPWDEAAASEFGYWEARARELHWFEPWHTTLDWQPPHAQWFVGGRLNLSYNCLDRHLAGWRRNKAALIWEGENGETRTYTYQQLHAEVCRFASTLDGLGVRKGDRVAIYLPLIPEAAIAMLACARVGAIHSVVFGGFSAESLSDRINDSACTLLITADGGLRRGQIVALKVEADKALEKTPSIAHVVVVKRFHGDLFPVHMRTGRDLWYHELLADAAPVRPAEPMESEDVLFILYTSGTTGKPKGIVHTTGGYSVVTAATTRQVFDLKDEDVFWCTADMGWVTGHSYVVYGPLQCGATVLMYEGAPDHPGKDRFWSMITRHRVTILYTAPTAIRAFMKWGEALPAAHDLSSLRLLGSVGEPINPEAWMWYHTHIGGGRCPVVDTWWQTETGGIMLSGLPGVSVQKPGFAGRPLPGVALTILDDAGQEVVTGSGILAITRPWPSMLRTLWGDDERFVRTYFSRWDRGTYFPGDGAKRDTQGRYMLLGRVDDVLNVAGHRIGTMEVESALVGHPSVAEAAVVGRAHEIKGQALVAFVTLRSGAPHASPHELKDELRRHVAQAIGAIARPEEVHFAADLPKTRSGKIMRRLLRDVAEGRVLGDTTTLADPNVVATLRDQYADSES